MEISVELALGLMASSPLSTIQLLKDMKELYIVSAPSVFSFTVKRVSYHGCKDNSEQLGKWEPLTARSACGTGVIDIDRVKISPVARVNN